MLQKCAGQRGNGTGHWRKSRCPSLHGMQGVSGSSPLDSISNYEYVINI